MTWSSYNKHLIFYGGDLLFRDGLVFNPDCCCEGCSACSGADGSVSGDVLEYMKVTISNMVDNSCSCVNAMNGVQWVPINNDAISKQDTNADCLWTCHYQETCDRISETNVIIKQVVGGTKISLVLGNILLNTFSEHLRWSKLYPTGFDCSLLSDGDITLDWDRATAWGSGICVGSGSTATILNIGTADTCCCCFGHCWPNDNMMAKQFQITVNTSFSNPDVVCSGCGDLNGTYIVNHRDQCPEVDDDDAINLGTEGQCWGGSFDAKCNYGFDTIRLALRRGGHDDESTPGAGDHYFGDVIITFLKACTRESITPQCPDGTNFCPSIIEKKIYFRGESVLSKTDKDCFNISAIGTDTDNIRDGRTDFDALCDASGSALISPI